MEQTNFIQYCKQTLHNGANKHYTMEKTNFTKWSKQNLHNGANKIYAMEQRKRNSTQRSKPFYTIKQAIFTQ